MLPCFKQISARHSRVSSRASSGKQRRFIFAGYGRRWSHKRLAFVWAAWMGILLLFCEPDVQPQLADGVCPALTPEAPKLSSGVHPQLTRSVEDVALQTRSLLSIDFHISPIADLKHFLSAAGMDGVTVTDRSLSGACTSAGTCATAADLAGLRPEDSRAMYLHARERRRFFEAYADIASLPLLSLSRLDRAAGGLLFGDTSGTRGLVTGADAMVCSHPTGMCELAMPFNRSLIIWATTRFELGRELNAGRMCGFVRNLRAMASLPGSVVLANNMYDVQYLRYFTGITPHYVPSFCNYTGATYTWPGPTSKKPILVHGFRAKFSKKPVGEFIQPLTNLAKSQRLPFEFRSLREALPAHYSYSELAEHPAVLHLPYQLSIMSFFEQYRMGVPIIAPSQRLMARWHIEYGLVAERTWDMTFRHRRGLRSVLPQHPHSDIPFDPNDDTDEAAVAWWIQWADFYTFPHVILFDSWEDLVVKLQTIDLRAVSAAMHEYNARQRDELADTWRGILRGLPSRADRHAADAALAGLSYEERMDAIYGPGGWAEY